MTVKTTSQGVLDCQIWSLSGGCGLVMGLVKKWGVKGQRKNFWRTQKYTNSQLKSKKYHAWKSKWASRLLEEQIFTKKNSKLLFNMTCQSVKGIRNNFHNFYDENIHCPFKCKNSYDTQAHVLSCPDHLSQYHKNDLNLVQYSDIFGSLLGQSKVIISFQQLMRVSERLLEES